MMYYGDHMTGWGWLAMSVGAVLFWGLLITALVVLVRYLSNSAQWQAARPHTRGVARRAVRPGRGR